MRCHEMGFQIEFGFLMKINAQLLVAFLENFYRQCQRNNWIWQYLWKENAFATSNSKALAYRVSMLIIALLIEFK